MADDFSTLKAGDKIIITDGDSRDSIHQINKVTDTQIQIKVSDTSILKFRRKDGSQIGGSVYFFSTLKLATPENLAAAIKAKRHSFLQRTARTAEWGKVSTEKLEKIYQILQENA